MPAESGQTHECGRTLKFHHRSWCACAQRWIKQEDAEHGRQLERDTLRVVANLQEHFPNLRIVYLGSRIYGGWADGQLNPEPYAYEGAYVVRWLINSQSEANVAAGKSPLLLWGPYFWGDGLKPRKSDGVIWERRDFVGDGTHPGNSGRQKVAEQLLGFFKNDEFAKTWFLTR